MIKNPQILHNVATGIFSMQKHTHTLDRPDIHINRVQ